MRVFFYTSLLFFNLNACPCVELFRKNFLHNYKIDSFTIEKTTALGQVILDDDDKLFGPCVIRVRG